MPARFRRAFAVHILTRTLTRAIQPWSLLQVSVKVFSQGMNIGLLIGKEPLTKSSKNFPLELRAKTPILRLYPGQLWGGVSKMYSLSRQRQIFHKFGKWCPAPALTPCGPIVGQFPQIIRRYLAVSCKVGSATGIADTFQPAVGQ